MKTLVMFAVLAAAALVLAGCSGDKSANLPVTKVQAFANSSPEVKQAWEKVVLADKTNDYATAETWLYWLARQDLTADQKQAVDNELTTVNQRLSVAVQKGDPAARSALEALRSNPPSRQR